MAAPMIVKKYSNRRLYDTVDSRYVTLEELTHKIRAGTDVQVLDASTGADLTQVTLTQIILESRGGAKLLPVPLLIQLIRMGDEALAEFFGRYMTWALEIYMRARSQAQAISPYVPLATVPFSATNALARMVLGASPWAAQQPGPPPMQQPIPAQPPMGPDDMPPPPHVQAQRGVPPHPTGMSAPYAPLQEPHYYEGPPQPIAHGQPQGQSPGATADDLAAIRKELEALRETVRNGKPSKVAKRRARAK
jgi:polyhydroxyalkanoate synthesis repressor PhaR